MILNELLGAVSWLSFEGAHCSVLEKRVAILSKEMHELHAQHAVDEVVFGQEVTCARKMSLALDKLEAGARSIDKKIHEVIPSLREKEATYVAQLQEMRSIACCMIVPERVLDTMQEIREALKTYNETKRALESALRQQTGV